MKVFILNTGTSNLASVVSAFQKLGCNVTVGSSRNDIENSEYLVLPGVGTFKAAMDQINKLGLVSVIKERINSNRPNLAICLGFQLLFQESQESPQTKGLGVIKGEIKRFPSYLRVPQMGWNKVNDGYAYFANSYCLMDEITGWSKTYSTYGNQKFISRIYRDRTLACQFHPELSGKWGLELIDNWLKQGNKNVN